MYAIFDDTSGNGLYLHEAANERYNHTLEMMVRGRVQEVTLNDAELQRLVDESCRILKRRGKKVTQPSVAETEESALIKRGYNDYELNPAANSAWITVNNLSVYIAKRGSNLTVEIYPLGQEDDDDAALAGCSARFGSTSGTNIKEEK